MKKFLIIILSCLLVKYSKAQTAGTITDINNHTVQLDSLNGKRVIVIMLPLVEDTAAENQLVRLKSKFGDTVELIGLVCLNNCNVSSATLAGIYSDAIEAGVIISVGSTVTNPANDLEGVLKYLSDKNINNRLTEAGLTGSKFFLSKQGKLYAQLGADVSLDSRMATNIIRAKVPGEN